MSTWKLIQLILRRTNAILIKINEGTVVTKETRSDGQHSAVNLEIQGREKVDLEAVDRVGAVEAIPRNAVFRGEFLEESLGHADVHFGRGYDDLTRVGVDSSQLKLFDRELSVFLRSVREVERLASTTFTALSQRSRAVIYA
ncbi:hypothetical protein L596_017769 [Steinernema carpocapsae]|uniref:Uncharacterized protein n=1 Tax=Steinernema carpocapsae TaxID=34508 RepID=A0A4U5N2L5_STECR|nr:hypothetical protein L596_017769 [Steinernema carpocapsae]